MINIREVAKLAGVSPATVSRVINGTAKVSAEKRARVLEAISATDFVPNEVARSLYRKSAKLIGLIFPSITNPYFTQVASIIESIASEHGYRVFLCVAGDDVEKEQAAVQTLVSMNADGIIIASTNESIAPYLDMCQIPVVAIDSMFATSRVEAYVCCDYYQGGRVAMEHLIDCGCERIVCIKGPQRIFSAKARYEGYRDVCRERGITERTVCCDYDFHAGLSMTEELLRLYPDVDGIIACNDVVALSTYKILHRKSISVPEQVQLIGFDDIAWSSLFTPALTTVSQPIEQMARRAMELIIDHKTTGEKGVEIVYPVQLTVRETTRKGSK
ncbi:MAG: LacI family DNA-binding transcriptional regulator [Oscillospiraceae bacterium]|nr:LacI family DNA-binding transcriptional regulator [Oscillospiraceae bacterium]